MSTLNIVYSLELPHWGNSNEYIQHTIVLKKIKKISLNYRYLLPELVPWLTLSGSNYPCLEQISMVPKMFEPLRFDCSLDLIRCNSRRRRLQSVWVSILSDQYLLCALWKSKNPRLLHVKRKDWWAVDVEADQSSLVTHHKVQSNLPDRRAVWQTEHSLLRCHLKTYVQWNLCKRATSETGFKLWGLMWKSGCLIKVHVM